MLPSWLIKKINDKNKDTFIQEQLRIEEYPPPQEIEKIEKNEEVVERGVIIIDLF